MIDPMMIDVMQGVILILLAISNIASHRKIQILKKVANPATSRQDKQKMLRKL